MLFLHVSGFSTMYWRTQNTPAEKNSLVNRRARMEVVPYGNGSQVLLNGVALPCFNDVSLPSLVFSFSCFFLLNFGSIFFPENFDSLQNKIPLTTWARKTPLTCATLLLKQENLTILYETDRLPWFWDLRHQPAMVRKTGRVVYVQHVCWAYWGTVQWYLLPGCNDLGNELYKHHPRTIFWFSLFIFWVLYNQTNNLGQSSNRNDDFLRLGIIPFCSFQHCWHGKFCWISYFRDFISC